MLSDGEVREGRSGRDGGMMWVCMSILKSFEAGRIVGVVGVIGVSGEEDMEGEEELEQQLQSWIGGAMMIMLGGDT